MLYFLSLFVLLTGCTTELTPEETKQRQLASVHKSIADYEHTPLQTVRTQAIFSQSKPKKSLPRDPQRLAHLVQSQLMKAPALSQSRVQTVSYFGNVLVVGAIQDPSNSEAIHKILRSNPQVKHFYTYLHTEKPNPKQYARDSILKTSIVKQFSELDTPTTHLQIIVSNGEVYLLGKLNKQQQQEVNQAVLRLPGVTKVHFSGSIE